MGAKSRRVRSVGVDISRIVAQSLVLCFEFCVLQPQSGVFGVEVGIVHYDASEDAAATLRAATRSTSAGAMS